MFNVDICLCEGNTCPLKERCLRYTYHLKDIASGVENYNTYFVDAPYEIDQNSCDYFYEVQNN